MSVAFQAVVRAMAAPALPRKRAVLQKRSLEYLLHVVLLVSAVVYLGFWGMYILSVAFKEELAATLRPPMMLFKHLGSPGFDVADQQWHDFVMLIPFISPFVLLFVVCSRKVRSSMGATPGIRRQLVFYLFWGLGLAFAVFGFGSLFSIGLMLANYFLLARQHHRLPYRVYLATMWVSHIAVLYLNYYFHGYSLSWLGMGNLEDLYTPPLRWYVLFNFVTLRMIAFNNDIWEASACGAETRAKVAERHRTTCVECAANREWNDGVTSIGTQCYKYRTDYPHSCDDYNLLGYLAYILYPSLVIAGPIISYNAFISYCYAPAAGLRPSVIAKYALRTFFIFATTLCMSHYNHVVSIVQTPTVMEKLPLKTKSYVLFMMLSFLWLKFNSIWKLSRLIAMLDGLEPVENLPRCFCNTTTIQGFWRDWHSSFNRWIVRYMYIPMGGKKTQILNIFPIFLFIAIWHDLELRLLFWALIICVCLIPELLVGSMLQVPRFRWLRAKWWYRYVRAAGVSMIYMALILANLIGFASGTSGATDTFIQLVASAGPLYWIGTVVLFFANANIAVQDRDQKELEEQFMKHKYFSHCDALEAEGRFV